jgi:hypothetical protein
MRGQRARQKGGSIEDFFKKYPSLSYFIFETIDQRASYNSIQQIMKLPTINIKHKMALDMFEEPVEKSLNKKYTIVLLEDEKVLCSGIFYFMKSKDAVVAHLLKMECERKTNTYKPISFVLMYFVLSILKYKSIDFLYFTVMAMDDHWKLYKLYHDMGFACVNPKSDDFEQTKEAFEEKRELNQRFFEANLSKVSAENFAMRCYLMFGYVPLLEHGLEKLLV